MGKIIQHFEGTKYSVYHDTNSEQPRKTIGVGFNLDQRGSREIFEKYLPDVSFDEVRDGKQSLTDPQVTKLFDGTLKIKIKETKDIFPNYDNYPKEVQIALVNGVFRGEFKKSHKTVEYINSGKWDKVFNEYIKRKDYNDANQPGVKKRMDYNNKIFKKYANELKKCNWKHEKEGIITTISNGKGKRTTLFCLFKPNDFLINFITLNDNLD